jgi:cell division protein FtsI (penicillin-binding protein 3)
VVINDPAGDLYHGGEVAAPVFSRVMKGALQVLNIAPDAQKNKTAAQQNSHIKNLEKVDGGEHNV